MMFLLIIFILIIVAYGYFSHFGHIEPFHLDTFNVYHEPYLYIGKYPYYHNRINLGLI